MAASPPLDFSSCSVRFPSFPLLDSQREFLSDLTYFFQWLPFPIISHRLAQGASLKTWIYLQAQVDLLAAENQSDKTISLYCSDTEAQLFKSLLNLSHKIEHIAIDQGWLIVKGIAASSANPKIESIFKQEERKAVHSYSVRFMEPNTALYIANFKTVLQQLQDAIRLRQKYVRVYAYGVDCELFAYILDQFFDFCVKTANIRPGYTLFIQIHELQPEQEPSILRRLQDMKQLIKTETPPCPRYSKALRFNVNSYEDPSQNTDSPKNSFLSPQEALDRFFPKEAVKNKNIAYCLATTYLAYQFHHHYDKRQLTQKERDGIWTQVDTHLPCIAAFITKRRKEKIQHLAQLKTQIEEKFFPAEASANAESLQQTDFYQTMRTLFPYDSKRPLVSVRINHSSLQICHASDASLHPQFIYLLSMLRSFANHQGIADKNWTAFVESMINVQEKHPIVGADAEETKILLMLRATSFSFFSHARSTIQSITANLLKYYQIKYMQPQNCPTCEFFVNKTDDFTTIRTATYSIKAGDEQKGEFVLKWIVSHQQGKWSFYIQIPSIELNSSCSPKEQEAIYEGFSSKS